MTSKKTTIAPVATVTVKTTTKTKAVKAEKKVTKAQRMEMCYRLKKETPTMLWRELGLRVGVSAPTAQKYVLIYAKRMKDDELIKALNWSIA